MPSPAPGNLFLGAGHPITRLRVMASAVPGNVLAGKFFYLFLAKFLKWSSQLTYSDPTLK
jgi:hypothetical protein